MQEKIQYLNMIQSNIRRYGWQSVAFKALSAIVAVLSVNALIATGSLDTMGLAVKLTFTVLLCTLMWLLDGHSSEMSSRYMDLYNESANEEDASFRMSLSVPETINPKALWRKTVYGYHLPIIFFLAAMVLTLR